MSEAKQMPLERMSDMELNQVRDSLAALLLERRDILVERKHVAAQFRESISKLDAEIEHLAELIEEQKALRNG